MSELLLLLLGQFFPTAPAGHPSLYLITQPVLIDLGLGVAVMHGYFLAQDVEGMLWEKAEYSET